MKGIIFIQGAQSSLLRQMTFEPGPEWRKTGTVQTGGVGELSRKGNSKFTHARRITTFMSQRMEWESRRHRKEEPPMLPFLRDISHNTAFQKRQFFSTTVWKHRFFGAELSLSSNSHIHTWLLEKRKSWPDEPFVSGVISLLFNTLSSYVIAFLSRSKHLLILWLKSLSAVILEPK